MLVQFNLAPWEGAASCLVAVLSGRVILVTLWARNDLTVLAINNIYFLHFRVFRNSVHVPSSSFYFLKCNKLVAVDQEIDGLNLPITSFFMQATHVINWFLIKFMTRSTDHRESNLNRKSFVPGSELFFHHVTHHCCPAHEKCMNSYPVNFCCHATQVVIVQ